MSGSGLDIRVNQCGSVRCERDWAWNSPSMPDYDLWYVWAGCGTLTAGDQTWPAEPGACFCLKPGEVYQGRHDPAQRLGVTYIHFDFIDPRGRVARLPPADRPPLWTMMTDIGWMEQLLKRVVTLQEAGEASAQLEARFLLRSALLHASRCAANPPRNRRRREHEDAIWAVARFVRENPGEIFSVDALSDRAGFTADHFTRLFARIVGQTPKEFCIGVRMQRARSLLAESNLGIEQIAAALGYADVFYFSRQFKHHVGQPPSAWRRSH